MGYMTVRNRFAAGLTTNRVLTITPVLIVSLLLLTGCAERAGPSVVTLAGGEAGYVDGPALTALFREPLDVSVDAQGHVYVADLGNRRVRRLSPGADSSWTVVTLAGSAGGSAEDGPALAVAFGELRNYTLEARPRAVDPKPRSEDWAIVIRATKDGWSVACTFIVDPNITLCRRYRLTIARSGTLAAQAGRPVLMTDMYD